MWNELPLVIAGFLDWCEAIFSVSRYFSVSSFVQSMNKRKQIGKKIRIAKRLISLCLRTARTSEVGNYMSFTWLLTLALNESCASRGISPYMITAHILLGTYKALPLWVLLLNFYSLESCKCAWEESVSVTNGNIKGEEKLQDFTDPLKFHVPVHQRLWLLSERCCFYLHPLGWILPAINRITYIENRLTKA